MYKKYGSDRFVIYLILSFFTNCSTLLRLICFSFKFDHYFQNVRFMLSKIGLNNSGGYLVQDLWSGELKGLLKPNDFYSVDVNPTGIDFFKATLPDL